MSSKIVYGNFWDRLKQPTFFSIYPKIATMTLSNWGDHLTDLATPKVQQHLADYGAKAGLLRFLRESDGELRGHILDGQYIEPHKIIQGNFGDIETGSGDSFLVRSSNPHDAYGFIGQLPTLSGTKKTYKDTLTQIRNILAHITVQDHHLKDDDSGLVSKTGLYIQPKIKCLFRGSVVEHPHFPGKYLISYSQTNFGEDIHSTALDMHLFDENGLDPNENLNSTGLYIHSKYHILQNW